MKRLITLVSATAVFLAASCGMNQNEKTSLLKAQKAKDDSTRVAQINYVKKVESLKSALGDSLAFYINLLSRQQNGLILINTALYTANDDMTQIQAFHLGRLPQTREQQVRDQELKIQGLLSQQTFLQTAIQQSTSKISAFKTQLGELKD
jgi:hypothetical protein